MKKIFLLCLFLIGCTSISSITGRYTSEILTEKAVVLETIYTPFLRSGYPASYQHSFNSFTQTYDIPEMVSRYSIVFHCEHDMNFVIEGEGDVYKLYWQTFSKGDSVYIQYKETYKKDKDGYKIITDFDFIDAIKFKKN